MEGTNDEISQLRQSLISSTHQVSAKHTSDRGHINYFDIQGMRWAYKRFLTPTRYVAHIIDAQNSDDETMSAEQQEANFINAVCAMNIRMLKDSEIFKLLYVAGETEFEFSPSEIEEYRILFKCLQEKLGKGDATRKDSVRHFVTDVLGRVSNDAPFLDGIAREFLVCLDLSYLTSAEVAVVYNTCQGQVTAEGRDTNALPELQKLQIQLQKETQLAEDLIAGRYEPINDIEGEVALMIALDMLSGSVNTHKRDSRRLRREVVTELSKLETACDDILSPVKTKPHPNRIILQANLFALYGDQLWERDEESQEEAFGLVKQRFCNEYPNAPVAMSSQHMERWIQLHDAYKLERDFCDKVPPPPPPSAPSPKPGTIDAANVSVRVQTQAKSFDMGRHGSSPLRREVARTNDISYRSGPGEGGWSSALPSRLQATNRWAERDDGSAGGPKSGAGYSGKAQR